MPMRSSPPRSAAAIWRSRSGYSAAFGMRNRPKLGSRAAGRRRLLVDDEHGCRVAVEPRADGVAEPVAASGLADHDEVPAALLGLLPQRRAGIAADDELGDRDLVGNQGSGLLDALLGPRDHLLAELGAAGRGNYGAGADDEGRVRRAGEEPDATVTFPGQLHGPL